MKSIIVFFSSLFLLVSSALQAQNVVFIFSAPEGEEIIKEVEGKHEKTVNFFVTGLNTVDEVNALVQKITAINGVKAFTISENVIDGQRAAAGIFEGCSSLDFFKNLLITAGIEDLIVNGEPLKSVDLQKVWKSKQNGDQVNPTGEPVIKSDDQKK